MTSDRECRHQLAIYIGMRKYKCLDCGAVTDRVNR